MFKKPLWQTVWTQIRIGAVCSGSTLFDSIFNSSVILGNYLQQTTSADNIFRGIFFLGALRVKDDNINFLTASGKFCRLLITSANSWHPHQARQNVGPDLDPSCLPFLKEYLKKKC